MTPAKPKCGFGVVKWNETIYAIEKGITRKTKKRYVDVISLSWIDPITANLRFPRGCPEYRIFSLIKKHRPLTKNFILIPPGDYYIEVETKTYREAQRYMNENKEIFLTDATMSTLEEDSEFDDSDEDEGTGNLELDNNKLLNSQEINDLVTEGTCLINDN
ncbi:uncharacterized protein LOC111705340 [Eurytemora carolleeae]|uniref:uncharacterized protein LOC111705340 n=1 Tax=Eurytemora carolleeae TaxID=1294199 RepID=UPI000C7915B8|nr:uncharacterized protein LOC111705340 [Eurytemora carolleeae]|eukprot:XP_023333607.1 uncharacterized protein LOC111705340 [Eurytemora affinis]